MSCLCYEEFNFYCPVGSDYNCGMSPLLVCLTFWSEAGLIGFLSNSNGLDTAFGSLVLDFMILKRVESSYFLSVIL